LLIASEGESEGAAVAEALAFGGAETNVARDIRESSDDERRAEVVVDSDVYDWSDLEVQLFELGEVGFLLLTSFSFPHVILLPSRHSPPSPLQVDERKGMDVSHWLWRA
jgi:hypothetical protein